MPPDSTILTGTLIPHGAPDDPNPNPDSFRHVAPLFPIEAVDPNSVSRDGALGPAPAGPPSYYGLEYYKQLVPNAEVTLPGSICSTCDPKELSPANTWTPRNLALLVERLGGAIVATHSQSGIMGHHMARILKERGHLDLLKGLITIEGSCSLHEQRTDRSRLRRRFRISRSKGTTRRPARGARTRSMRSPPAAPTKQGTARADYLKLDEMGMLGVTHMMMLDRRNLEIADILLNWVNKNVRKNAKRGVVAN